MPSNLENSTGARKINLGKIGKGVSCSVTGCKNPAERSISRDQMGGSGLSVSGDRRVYLCHEHYKVWKKTTKKDR
ncbi:MAG TPA: hypothetical protein VN739_08955, partial [Nitrososphaerales archaeon]|nr:hypothetical protein [Nitrososphaerales archaeon]